MDSDRVQGNLKEAEGKLTGDAAREQQGKVQSGVGEAKDTAGDAWEKTKKTAGEWKDKVSKKAEELIPGDSDQDGR
jgi:uncharacterized protein YjbJ (UPF0337 family)